LLATNHTVQVYSGGQDKARRTERRDRLCVRRMMLVSERG